MKNLWKGLVVGAFTGAAVGVLADAANGGRKAGRELAEQGRDKLADAHLGSRVHELAVDLTDKVRSDIAPAAAEAVGSATDAVERQVAPRVDAASEAIRGRTGG